MALTLLEMSKIAAGRDEVVKSAIMEYFANGSELLSAIPWETIQGNAVTFNRESTLPTVAFRGVNEAYTASEGKTEKITESLAIAGGDIDVDKFLVDTGGPGQRDVQEQLKAKSMALSIVKNLIKGDVTSTPKGIDGFQRRCLASDNLVQNAASTAVGLSLAKLDEAIDNVDNPTHIIMNKATKRRFSAAARSTSVGGYITYDVDTMGAQVMRYAGLPILAIDKDETNTAILPFTETDPASGSIGCSLYVVSFTSDGVVGLQGPGGMDVRDLGEISTQPVFRTRVEWYIGLAVYRVKSLCRLWGFTDVAITA